MTDLKKEPYDFQPAYIALLESGELEKRAEQAFKHLENCDLCARCCRVNRRKTIRGTGCHTGERAVVHSFNPHHGEEAPLRGWSGSGTIFFGWCNLHCVYCHNGEISQKGLGHEVEPKELAEMMCELQDQGCHNLNFVSPSHVVAPTLAALFIAAGQGLRLPLVFNAGGYGSMETLALLDGVVDIYMPDMKYGDSQRARRYSHVSDYWEKNKAAIRDMHRQVGDLVIDEQGLARRGLLVRHLVLPGGLVDTDKVMKFISEDISKNTYLNLMDQYHPCYQAFKNPPLDRPITREEYKETLKLAEKHGLRRLDRRYRLD